MTTPKILAQPYAVVRNDGVVIDRLLLTELAYEAVDWAKRYPDCELELDLTHAKPIGFGLPALQRTPEEAEQRERQYRQQLATKLTGEAQQALLDSLSEPALTAAPEEKTE